MLSRLLRALTSRRAAHIAKSLARKAGKNKIADAIDDVETAVDVIKKKG